MNLRVASLRALFLVGKGSLLLFAILLFVLMSLLLLVCRVIVVLLFVVVDLFYLAFPAGALKIQLHSIIQLINNQYIINSPKYN